MNRRYRSNIIYLASFLFSMASFTLGCGEAGASKNTITQAAQNKPNVIIIYADDLGYGDLSCYGSTLIKTPNIDSLAKEGLRFTNAHSMASTCTPSRFSLLTGEYAFRKASAKILPGNASLLISTEQATLGTIFQQAGYRTGCVGKWHIGLGPEEGPDWNDEIKPGPNEVGFDYSFIFPATADRVPTVYVENHKVVALDHGDPIMVSYEHKVGDDPTAKDHPELLKMKSSPGDHYGTIVNGIGRIGWMAGGHSARWTDESLAEDFLAQAQMFVEKNKDNPFFLYYAVHEIHEPCVPGTRFKEKSALGFRGDVTLEMDYIVGQIMRTLDCLNLTENTIVIFTSDNGPVLNDGYIDNTMGKNPGLKPAGPFRGGKYSLFEGGTRVPLIVKWPGKVKPGVSDALMNQVDLLASFAGMQNIKLNPGDGIDSHDELNALFGKSDRGRETNVEQNNGGALALVKGDWKYIPPHKGPVAYKWAGGIESGFSVQPQLYNLKEDRGEQNNLASKYPDKVKEMDAQLKKIKEKEHTRY